MITIRLRKKRISRSWMGDIFLFLLLAAVGYFMAVPLVFVISNAFKPINEILKFPPDFLVNHPTFTNFRELYHLLSVSWGAFTRYIFNTFFIAIVGAVGHVLIGSLAAYPLAKRKFPGKAFL